MRPPLQILILRIPLLPLVVQLMFGFLGGQAGGPEAWDFSVTSAFRLGPAAPDPAAFAGVFSSVETRKRVFLDTASQCSRAGINFCPLVIKAVGGDVPKHSALSCHGSRAKVTATPPLVIPILVSRSRSASHAPSTGKTRARS